MPARSISKNGIGFRTRGPEVRASHRGASKGDIHIVHDIGKKIPHKLAIKQGNNLRVATGYGVNIANVIPHREISF
jgi:hypothetical protein